MGKVSLEMRVIAGKYRGRNLRSPPSLQVRPTSDRLRETLFNVIAPRIAGARFLDLCAGSGAVGIEALSRDAAHVTFVDQSQKMVQLIKTNLELCRIERNQTDVAQSDAVDFLRRSEKRRAGSWDIIFFDPPYAEDYLPVLERLGAQTESLHVEDGLLIVEHDKKNLLPDQIGVLERNRLLKQGDSALSFYERSETLPIV